MHPMFALASTATLSLLLGLQSTQTVEKELRTTLELLGEVPGYNVRGCTFSIALTNDRDKSLRDALSQSLGYNVDALSIQSWPAISSTLTERMEVMLELLETLVLTGCGVIEDHGERAFTQSAGIKSQWLLRPGTSLAHEYAPAAIESAQLRTRDFCLYYIPQFAQLEYYPIVDQFPLTFQSPANLLFPLPVGANKCEKLFDNDTWKLDFELDAPRVHATRRLGEQGVSTLVVERGQGFDGLPSSCFATSSAYPNSGSFVVIAYRDVHSVDVAMESALRIRYLSPEDAPGEARMVIDLHRFQGFRFTPAAIPNLTIAVANKTKLFQMGFDGRRKFLGVDPSEWPVDIMPFLVLDGDVSPGSAELAAAVNTPPATTLHEEDDDGVARMRYAVFGVLSAVLAGVVLLKHRSHNAFPIRR